MRIRKEQPKEHAKVFLRKITASLTAFFFYSSFLLIPSNQAKADFTPLADPSSVAAFQAICEDMGLVINLTRTYRKLFKIKTKTDTTSVSGLAAYLADEADYIPKMCSLIMAVATASNTAGVLRAARIANQIGKWDLENQLDAVEDTIDIADFVQNLSKFKDSKDLKYKILNASNHARIIRYLQRNAGLTDGSDGVADMSAALDAQVQMSNLAGQLFSGCKVPVKKDQAPSDKIFDADGKELNPGALIAIEGKRAKALTLASESLREADAAHKLLNKMIATVGTSPEEVRSDSFMLMKFRTEAFWLSFGFLPPGTATKVGVDVVIQDCPKDEFREKPRVRNGKLVICKQTTEKNAFYASQGSVDGSQCSRAKKGEYEATTWMVKNMPILANRYYNYQSLSAAVNVCPYSLEQALGEFTIGDLRPEKNEDMAEKIKESNLTTLEENCKKKDMDEEYKKLSKLGPIGTEQWDFNVDLNKLKCKPTRQQRADVAETVYVKNKNINNMRDLIKVYSDRFQNYADITYSLHLTDNPVSKTIRYFVTTLERGAADATSSSSISRWNDQAGLSNTSGQQALQREWRQFSTCHRPATLKRRYPSEYKNAYIEDKKSGEISEVEGVLAPLKNKCLLEEAQLPSGKIFEQTFEAMMDAMESYFNAQKNALEVDLRMGKFRGAFSDKDKVVCEQALNITDINLATAQATVRMYEAFANADRYNRERHLKEEAEKKDMENARNELNNVLTMTTNLKERELKSLLLNKVDIEGSRNPDFKGMTPSLMNQRKMEKGFTKP